MPSTKRLKWIFALAFALTPALAAHATPPTVAPVEDKAATQLYVFTYRPGPAWRAGVPTKQQGLKPHGAYMQSLLDSGRLFAAGGFVDGDGGMAIVYAPSLDEARRLLAADPAVSSGIFVGEIQQWRPRFRATGPLPSLD